MIRRQIAIAAMLVVGVGCQQAAAPTPTQRLLGGQLSGVPYAIAVPANWNGTLMLYSHGTIVARPGRRILLGAPDVAPDAGTRQWLLTHGYALAASAYATPTGWAVQDALPDQIALLDYFQHAVGKPRRAIAWGDSQGGLDTALLLERSGNRFAGGLSLCGLLGGGVSYFNHDLDMFATLDALLAPGTLLHATAPTRAGIDSTNAEGVIATAQSTAAGQARLALVAAIQDFPARFNPSDREPASGDWPAVESGQANWIRFQLGTAFRQDIEQKSMGNPSWNIGVDYTALFHASPYAPEVTALYRSAGLDLGADLNRVARAPRITADPAAVRFMTEFGQPTGALTRPLLTIHTTDDGRVIPGNERAYQDLVARHGRPSNLESLFVSRGGHCALADAEIIASFQTLIHRIDAGTWPDTSPAAMNVRAALVGTPYTHLAPLDYSITDAGQFVGFTPPPLPR